MESAESLWHLCLRYCARNLESWCLWDSDRQVYTLPPDILLSNQICDSLLEEFTRCGHYNIDQVVHIFEDTQRTKVSRVVLRDTDITDKGLACLWRHRPTEVNISGCRQLSSRQLDAVNKYGDNLRVFIVGDSKQVFHHADIKRMLSSGYSHLEDHSGGVIMNASRLQVFSVHELDTTDVSEMQVHDLVSVMLRPLTSLTYLDLSACQVRVEQMDCLLHLRKLCTLILYEVPIFDMKKAIQLLVQLNGLKALNLARAKENAVIYKEPEGCLQTLVAGLPELSHLDISGTNLAGFLLPSQRINHSLKCPRIEDTTNEHPIAGLEGRYFEFLGLFGCAYDACGRQNIPARLVTGTANETQIITAVEAYVDRSELLMRALNHLFDIFRQGSCLRHLVALKGILAAMQRHKFDRNIQISGSASLFYIVKGSEKDNMSLSQKREVVLVILDAMENHRDEATMLRNGCLTLCHVNIPKDLLFEYERIVRLLLSMVRVEQQDEFIQRIGIFLLNSLACQVEEHEKVTVGNLGAIEVMCEIIRKRLNRGVCDEVMEVAWSLMWNITDETAVNSERFIKIGGMELFLDCLKKFSSDEELLRNMMGLMGNVAEVKELRPTLMKSQFITVFSNLLRSSSDGIEVSYNACGVLAHMVADGEQAWTIQSPTRAYVHVMMLDAIRCWNLKTRRHINYRSFEPIMRLISQSHSAEAQHWAIWALCNLTKMQRAKYCALLIKEGDVDALRAVLRDSHVSSEVHDLAAKVVERCDIYLRDPAYASDAEENMDAN